MSLFNHKNFTLSSGLKSDFKIDCDDLSYADIECLCYLISKRVKFFSVFGVPSGGIKFQNELRQYCSNNPDYPTLIVDDVLTTGKSINNFVKEQNVIKNRIGVVIFSRGKCPKWVTPIFQMW